MEASSANRGIAVFPAYAGMDRFRVRRRPSTETRGWTVSMDPCTGRVPRLRGDGPAGSRRGVKEYVVVFPAYAGMDRTIRALADRRCRKVFPAYAGMDRVWHPQRALCSPPTRGWTGSNIARRRLVFPAYAGMDRQRHSGLSVSKCSPWGMD